MSVRKYKESAIISTNNIDFALSYDQMNEDCMVRYFPQEFPAWGVLVDENGNIVNSLNIECSKFKLRGFRYKLGFLIVLTNLAKSVYRFFKFQLKRFRVALNL